MDALDLLSWLSLVCGGAGLILLARGNVAQQAWLRPLVSAAVVAAGVSYTSVWWQSPQWMRVHLHDYFHYFLGAKYYPELGHTRIYRCAVDGFASLAQAGVAVPAIGQVRDLEHAWRAPRPVAAGETGSGCRNRFTAARWDTWLADLRVLLDYDAETDLWRGILTDLGNNSPPTWNLLAHPAANLVPLSRATLIAFPLFDQVLLLMLVPFLVWRTFGRDVVLGYLLVYFTNPLAGFGWNAGSFLRSLWLSALVGGICTLGQRQQRAAGILLAGAALMRVFPVMFAAAALWGQFNQRSAGVIRSYVTAGVVTTACLLGGTLLVFGSPAWTEFLHILGDRVVHFGNNSIGLATVGRTWAVGSWPEFSGGADSLAALERWVTLTSYDLNTVQPIIVAIAGAMVVGSLVATLRADPVLGTVVCGTVSIYCLATPFTYYYSFLALLPVALSRSVEAARAPALGAVFAGIAALRICSPRFQQALGFDPGYFEVSSTSSIVLGLTLLALLAILLWSRRSTDDVGRPAVLALLAVFTAATLLIAVATRSTRVDPQWQPLTGRVDIRAAAGVKFAWQPATTSWPGEGYLDIRFDAVDQWVELVPRRDADATPLRRLLLVAAPDHGTLSVARGGAVAHVALAQDTVAPVALVLPGSAGVVRITPAPDDHGTRFGISGIGSSR
ncbi:MAG: hypothetical protein AB7Q81_24220 [Gammaproteobacteria bacterium]